MIEIYNAVTGEQTDGVPAVSLYDRAFRYGDGLFETLRFEQGLPRWLKAHTERYAQGARALRLDAPPAVFAEAVRMFATRATTPEGLIRATLSAGAGGAGYRRSASAASPPLLYLTSRPLPGRRITLRPLKLRIARQTAALPPACVPAGIKHLQRLNSVLAAEEAARYGADDALLLTPGGAPAETASGNLFVRIGGIWLTPSVALTGATAGIVRGRLLRLMPRAREEEMTLGDLRRADAAVITNVSGLARPVAALYPENLIFPGSVEAAKRLRAALRRRQDDES